MTKVVLSSKAVYLFLFVSVLALPTVSHAQIIVPTPMPLPCYSIAGMSTDTNMSTVAAKEVKDAQLACNNRYSPQRPSLPFALNEMSSTKKLVSSPCKGTPACDHGIPRVTARSDWKAQCCLQPLY